MTSVARGRPLVAPLPTTVQGLTGPGPRETSSKFAFNGMGTRGGHGARVV